MSRQPVYFHMIFWLLAFVVWLVLTTTYHPTWPLRIACTLMLTLMSAVFACRCTPRTVDFASIMKALFALLACGFVAAAAIHLIYDALVGPDPNRFPFFLNVVMDTMVVALNTLVAALIAFIIRRLTSRPTWFL